MKFEDTDLEKQIRYREFLENVAHFALYSLGLGSPKRFVDGLGSFVSDKVKKKCHSGSNRNIHFQRLFFFLSKHRPCAVCPSQD
jgi:hypothetical protein